METILQNEFNNFLNQSNDLSKNYRNGYNKKNVTTENHSLPVTIASSVILDIVVAESSVPYIPSI